MKAKPAKANGKTVLCEHGPNTCPDGYTCIQLAFHGICCPKKEQNEFDTNMRPQCKNGKSTVKIDRGGWQMVLLGKSCDDQFCPDNSECFQQSIFASCCR
ncbi:hypothetical protein AB6A40_005071 [Gnathostoma spinigerum]|uniref:Uncharacterized protein n=1 Tax=Gnathostoma spinigerum TaxID=75299 RepID=A0ABD6ENW1_9BILA